MSSIRRNVFEAFDEVFEQTKKETSLKGLTGELVLHASLDPKEVARNIEIIHSIGTRRISLIGYHLEWASAVENRLLVRPDWHLADAPSKFKTTFSLSSPAIQSDDSIRIANNNFVQSLRTHVLKDFSEFFELYLDCLFGKLLLIQKQEDGLTERDIKSALKFTRRPTEDKLKKLTDLGFNAKMSDAVISLAKARNLYVHTDSAFSPPTRKHLENECIWYSHSINFRERVTGELVPLENMPEVLYGDHYSQIEVVFLDPQRKKSVLVNNEGKLILTDADLREISFFYMVCFEEYHKELISFAIEHGIPAKSIDEYSGKNKLEVSIRGEPCD
jgi:hypothetical protein